MAPLTVTLKNYSENAIGYTWFLPDKVLYAKTPSPQTFSKPGTYQIKLRAFGQVTNSSGDFTRTVIVHGSVEANFNVSTSSGMADKTEFSFTDASTGEFTTWSWDFGDGGTSDLQNPLHTYSSSGTYTVGLTVTGGAGSSTKTRSELIVVTSNRPPVIEPGIPDVTVNEDADLVLDLTRYENDEQSSSAELRWKVSVLEGASLLSSYNTDGGDSDEFRFTPLPNAFGEVVLRFVLRDDDGATVAQNVRASWRSKPDPPRVHSPDPGDIAKGRPTYIALKWQAEDPDPKDILAFTVLFGKTNPPTVSVTNDALKSSIQMSGLEESQTYYWQITVRDTSGLTTVGPVWTFSTISDSLPPVLSSGPRVVGVTNDEATVQWTTDELSKGSVKYSLLSNLAEAKTVGSEALITSHDVRLVRLLPDTTYYYQVRAADRFGNATGSQILSFTTIAMPDTLSPQIISGPLATGITHDQAMIQWRTHETATSIVELGEKPGLAQSSVFRSTALVTEHSVALRDLQLVTTYYYRVISADATGNLSSSGIRTFTTRSVPDTVGPLILGGPLIDGITEESVSIQWMTNEISTGVVEYGLTESHGLFREGAKPALNPSVSLFNLVADTIYHYRAYLKDPSGNTSLVIGGAFRTSAAPDSTPPVILSHPIATGITDQTAFVKWTTGEKSDSRMEFGIMPDFSEPAIILDSDRVLEHLVSLGHLSSETTYYYRISSADESANTSIFKEGSLTTLALPDTLSPIIMAGPAVTAISNNSAQIEWETDEDAESTLSYVGDGVEAVAQNAERRRQHRLMLSELLPATRYIYAIRAADGSGNETLSSGFGFTTLAAPDSAAPVIISGPVVSNRLHQQAVIEWVTDEASSSEIAYGLTDGYGSIVAAIEVVQEHKIQLTGLERSTTYHYQVRSKDTNGNGPVQSADMTFTTLAAPDTTAPQIVAAPVVLERSNDLAVITWGTDELADSYIEYGLDSQYGSIVADAAQVTQHVVKLTNLEPATRYFYRVSSVDLTGNGPVYGAPLSFLTRTAPDTLAPVIVTDPFVTSKTPNTATIQWVTDEPSDSRVRYGVNASYGSEKVMPEDLTLHTVTLSNLESATEYHVEVGSIDARRNGPTVSPDLSFTTASQADTLAPRILNGPTVTSVSAEGATIEWVTDEPATSALDYGTSTTYGLGHIERADRVKSHVVTITNLKASSTYHFRIASEDESYNTINTDPHGTQQYSRDHSFQTLLGDDGDPPVFLEGPIVYARDEGATFLWRTDERVRYELVYDTVPTLNSPNVEIIQSNELNDTHGVDVARLERGTTYYYSLTVWDLGGLSSVAISPGTEPLINVAGKLAQLPAGGGGFVTLQEPDAQVPVIVSQPRVTAKIQSSVTIEWETDELSDGFVAFGQQGILDQVVGAPFKAIHHKVVLTNLIAGASYDYQVASTDASGKCRLQL